MEKQPPVINLAYERAKRRPKSSAEIAEEAAEKRQSTLEELRSMPQHIINLALRSIQSESSKPFDDHMLLARSREIYDDFLVNNPEFLTPAFEDAILDIARASGVLKNPELEDIIGSPDRQ